MTSNMRIAIVTPDLSDNSLGRTYCLWLLANAAGFNAQVYSTTGTKIWEPLNHSDFSSTCTRLDESDLSAELAGRFDLIIAVKPLATSLGVAHRTSLATGIPLLLDIDDPDLEAKLSWRDPLRRLKRGVLHGRTVREFSRMRRLSRRYPKIVSNPYLQRLYGGQLIPHVRTPTLLVSNGSGEGELKVAFVGTNRPHKGVDLLREAVSRLQPAPVSLTVTDYAPDDAAPWENWVGPTSLEDGIALVRRSNAVVLPSAAGLLSHGQLPVKLVDAMMLGKAVVVTRVEPMPWAVGDTGLVLRRRTAGDVAQALESLLDEEARSDMGTRARKRAMALFSVDANLERFVQACGAAVEARPNKVE